MRYLYIDNIRGFTDTYIPIKDVNFFVGENSTGKTTILEIIKILSDHTFWLFQNFSNIKELRFSSYQNIVNSNSQDKSYFRFGMIEYKDKVKRGQSKLGSVFLLTFSNQNEMPIISEYYWINGEYEIKIIIHKNDIMYKASSIGQLSNTDTYQIFKNWTNCEIKNSEGYEKEKIQFARELPLPAIAQIIEDKVLKKNESKPKNGDEKILKLPSFAAINLVWLAPIRSQPMRTYDEYKYNFSPEGEHIPYILRELINKKRNLSAAKKDWNSLCSFGKDSGLFDSIEIKEFGKGIASPFEIDVIINNSPFAIKEVGYGISQALPVIIELLARPKGTWYAIQQPEIHLHPRAQAALGERLYLMAVEEKKRFFIETHSDYIIDRFRMCYQKYDQKDLDSQVLYFERTPTGNKVYPIEIEKTGQYSEDQPSTFRDFFLKEAIALLGV